MEKIQAITFALPKQVQAKLKPVQDGIQDTLAELTGIVTSDIPVGEKVSKVGSAVQEKLHPLLVQTTQTIQTYIADAKTYIGGAKAKTEDVAEEAKADAAEKTDEVVQEVHNHEEDVPSFVA